MNMGILYVLVTMQQPRDNKALLQAEGQWQTAVTNLEAAQTQYRMEDLTCLHSFLSTDAGMTRRTTIEPGSAAFSDGVPDNQIR
jgi:hypothetical protein